MKCQALFSKRKQNQNFVWKNLHAALQEGAGWVGGGGGCALDLTFTTLLANSADDENIFHIFHRKQVLTYHAN